MSYIRDLNCYHSYHPNQHMFLSMFYKMNYISENILQQNNLYWKGNSNTLYTEKNFLTSAYNVQYSYNFIFITGYITFVDTRKIRETNPFQTLFLYEIKI